MFTRNIVFSGAIVVALVCLAVFVPMYADAATVPATHSINTNAGPATITYTINPSTLSQNVIVSNDGQDSVRVIIDILFGLNWPGATSGCQYWNLTYYVLNSPTQVLAYASAWQNITNPGSDLDTPVHIYDLVSKSSSIYVDFYVYTIVNTNIATGWTTGTFTINCI